MRFTAELQRVSESLGLHTPDGPCDDSCGCTTDHNGQRDSGVTRGAASVGEADPPIACTLGPGHIADRVTDWQAALSAARGREPIDGCVRLHFLPTVDVVALVQLAVAEQNCCRFLRFGVTFDGRDVALDITGPPDAQPVIDALLGPAA